MACLKECSDCIIYNYISQWSEVFLVMLPVFQLLKQFPAPYKRRGAWGGVVVKVLRY
jgi:hypothetical protein